MNSHTIATSFRSGFRRPSTAKCARPSLLQHQISSLERGSEGERDGGREGGENRPQRHTAQYKYNLLRPAIDRSRDRKPEHLPKQERNYPKKGEIGL